VSFSFGVGLLSICFFDRGSDTLSKGMCWTGSFGVGRNWKMTDGVSLGLAGVPRNFFEVEKWVFFR